MTYFVLCSACDTEHSVDEVEFLDIEEDFQGRDRMTFKCNCTNTQQSSLVYGNYGNNNE